VTRVDIHCWTMIPRPVVLVFGAFGEIHIFIIVPTPFCV
jgi:hypothetical protein